MSTYWVVQKWSEFEMFATFFQCIKHFLAWVLVQKLNTVNQWWKPSQVQIYHSYSWFLFLFWSYGLIDMPGLWLWQLKPWSLSWKESIFYKNSCTNYNSIMHILYINLIWPGFDSTYQSTVPAEANFTDLAELISRIDDPLSSRDPSRYRNYETGW